MVNKAETCTVSSVATSQVIVNDEFIAVRPQSERERERTIGTTTKIIMGC